MSSQVTEPCETCGRPSDDPSHIVRRAHGGTETVQQCRTCHENFEQGRWFIADSDRGWWRRPDESLSMPESPDVPAGMLHIYDHEGTLLAERPRNPRDGLVTLTRIGHVRAELSKVADEARTDEDDALPDIHENLKDIETQAHTAARQQVLDALARMPYGTTREKMVAVASSFAISIRTVYNYLLWARARDLLPTPLQHVATELPVRLLQAAMRDPDPEEALIHAQHRHHEEQQRGEHFTADQFAHEREHTTETHRCRVRVDAFSGERISGDCPLREVLNSNG